MGARGTGRAYDPATADDDAGADIERLLGRQPTTATTAAGAADLSGWLRNLVGEPSVPDIADEQQALLAMVDAAIGELMRRVLHDPAVQSLEARWRGLERLVRDLELGESRHLFLLDVAHDELVQDIQTHAGDLSRSDLHGHLCGPHTEAPDSTRWSLLAVDLSYGADLDELQLLAALGALAGRAGAPLLAAAKPSLPGAQTLDQYGPGSRSIPPPWPSGRHCAEVAMGEAAGTALLGHGLIPLLSYRNAARLLRWQSIADPVQPLRGAWAGTAGR